MTDDRYPPPRSALGLRAVLAVFGLLVSFLATVGFAVAGYPVVAVLTALVGVTAAVDLIVIRLRARQRDRDR